MLYGIWIFLLALRMRSQNPQETPLPHGDAATLEIAMGIMEQMPANLFDWLHYLPRISHTNLTECYAWTAIV